MDKERLADILYTTYCDSVGGKAYNGDPLPSWRKFSTDPKKEKQTRGWLDAAQKAIKLLY